MRMSFSVYLPEAGVDLGGEVQLIVNSDEPNKLLFKSGTPFMVTKEDLLNGLAQLETHLKLDNPTPDTSVK